MRYDRWLLRCGESDIVGGELIQGDILRGDIVKRKLRGHNGRSPYTRWDAVHCRFPRMASLKHTIIMH